MFWKKTRLFFSEISLPYRMAHTSVILSFPNLLMSVNSEVCVILSSSSSRRFPVKRKSRAAVDLFGPIFELKNVRTGYNRRKKWLFLINLNLEFDLIRPVNEWWGGFSVSQTLCRPRQIKTHPHVFSRTEYQKKRTFQEMKLFIVLFFTIESVKNDCWAPGKRTRTQRTVSGRQCQYWHR